MCLVNQQKKMNNCCACALSKTPGRDHSRFIVVPDWYANGCCRVLALEQTQYSMLNVYLVFKNKVHKVQVSEKYV